MNLERTGEKIAFLDLSIGNPFFAHGRFFVRTDFAAGTELKDSGYRAAQAFDFLIEGTVEPKHGPYSRAGEKCEEVEVVKAIP